MDLLGELGKLWIAGGAERTAVMLEAILADEVNHVRFANRWIKRLAREDGRVVLKVALAMRFLAAAIDADRKEPIPTADGAQHSSIGVNVDDRRLAEFTDDEIDEILRQSGMP